GPGTLSEAQSGKTREKGASPVRVIADKYWPPENCAAPFFDCLDPQRTFFCPSRPCLALQRRRDVRAQNHRATWVTRKCLDGGIRVSFSAESDSFALGKVFREEKGPSGQEFLLSGRANRLQGQIREGRLEWKREEGCGARSG